MSEIHDRSLFGLCRYYRTFIAYFASIAEPLHKLKEKTVSFKWTEICQTALDLLKNRLTSSHILEHPDIRKQFILDTEESQFVDVKGHGDFQ